MASRPYNLMSLCAGVGGLELGVRIAVPGARAVCVVEREIPAAARLVARMQDGSLHPAPIWSDLTTFDGLPWRGLVDCLTSGDPCQPNSVAGKGLGKDDDRWLLDHVFRIIDEVRPARVFRENVPGNADGQLAAIVPALEGMGYRVAAGIFSARGAGASHLRERLFIMADRDGPRCASSWAGPVIDPRREPLPGSGDVANADGGDASPERQQRGRQQRLLKTGAGNHPNLVHASGNGRGEGRPEPELRSGRDASSVTGGAMGDTLGRGDGRQSSEPGRGSIVGAAADGAGDCGVGMADTGCSGSQGFGDGDHQSGRQEPDGYAGLEGRAGLLFAPGPNDPTWVQIIGSAPHLAPAVADVDVALALFSEGVGSEGVAAQAQSVLRRLDAWLAQRVDRLRAGGNGVSSLAAALAWRTLEASLAADLGRSTQPLRLKDQAA